MATSWVSTNSNEKRPLVAKTKEPLWVPPEDVVRELLDAAAEKLPSDAIYPADIVKPAAEPLRDLLNGMLAFGTKDGQLPPLCPYDVLTKEQTFACLKAALIQAKAEHGMREEIRKSYQREEKRAEERLEILETVAWEMLESYGEGEKLAIHTPYGDLRRQRNSKGSVWVDESRIDEIPEVLGEFRLVKVTKTPLKEGIGQWLEDMPEAERPEWAELREPGYHLKFS